jgi:hypothetical protein
MFENISARTAALFGIVAGMALSATTGLRPHMPFEMKVHFQPHQQNNESIDPANKLDSSPVIAPLENQPSSARETCPACGMG